MPASPSAALIGYARRPSRGRKLLKLLLKLEELTNKYPITIMVIMCLCACNVKHKRLPQRLIDYQALTSIKTGKIKYDTLAGLFYYENRVEAYIEGDAIVKDGGYVRVTEDVSRSYFDGYYILSRFYIERLKYKYKNLHFNLNSIDSFASKQYRSAIFSEGGLWEKTKINPYCGVYYKKYFLKIEVVKVGKVKQRIPFFEDCDAFMKRKNNNYSVAALPTYIITNVFEYTEY